MYKYMYTYVLTYDKRPQNWIYLLKIVYLFLHVKTSVNFTLHLMHYTYQDVFSSA